MHAKHLLHHLVESAAARDPARIALVGGDRQLRYEELEAVLHAFRRRPVGLGLARGERVGIYLDKRPEFVAAAFGTSAAGGVFVPINPVLKAAQVATSCATARSASSSALSPPHSHECPYQSLCPAS